MTDAGVVSVSHTTRIVHCAKSTAMACRDLVQCAVDVHSQCMAGDTSGDLRKQQWPHTVLYHVSGWAYVSHTYIVHSFIYVPMK